MFETIANKYQRTLKRKLKVPEIAGREVSWTSFAWVRMAHGAGIHVSVCVLACLDCQNQFTCELKLFAQVALTISVCSRICGFTNGLRSNTKLLK